VRLAVNQKGWGSYSANELGRELSVGKADGVKTPIKALPTLIIDRIGKYNIKINVRRLGCEGIDWIRLTQN
jgi:hypothetical protein